MIKVKKVVSGGFYLFQGRASANSLFIEDISEAKQFIILANYYLKGYLKIHEYLLSIDSWNFIVTINSSEKIAQKIGINASDYKLEEEEIWRIISERMRILLSTFIKFTNKKQGRTGSKVHSSYERYVFQSVIEAKKIITQMRNGLIKLSQKRTKYRAKKSHYKISKKLGKGSIFMSSRKLKKRIKRCGEKLSVLKIQAFNSNVVSNLIFHTINSSFSPKHPPNHK